MKIHCSSLPALMTNGRKKDDVLSETAKTMLRELWIKEKYGRVKFDKVNKYTTKGIVVESDSLELVSTYLSVPLFKNNKELENKYLIGTPDVIGKDFVMDIKSSWDIWTFAEIDEEKARKQYYWQLIGYALLTGKLKMELVFALSNTPDWIINDELYRLSFKVGDSNEIQEQIKKNYIYDDISASERVKVFTFNLTEEEKLKEKKAVEEKVIAANKYLKSLSL